jgi:hypothetical protein
LDIEQLFTPASLLTLQGSAAAAYLVPNVLGKMMTIGGRGRAWIAFVIAMGLSLLALTLLEKVEPINWVVAVINGFLIAASALGINEVTSGGGGALAAASNDRFKRTWLAG